MFIINYMLLLACVTGSHAFKKPNFIIFLTDDQDYVMEGMSPMKNVQRFIGNKGVTFTNSYTTSPICCPSRASILTGMYLHNHKTHNNSISGGCYGTEWKTHEKNTYAAILKEDGYNTFYAGKYLNEYGVKEAGGPEVVPPGWSEWHGLVGNSVYYNYTISNNGVPTHYKDLYLTDAIRDLAITYIEGIKDQPFLMTLAPPAPHQPFTPAPRHKGLFSNATVYRPENFNVAVKDKHWLMSMPPSPLPDSMLPQLDSVFRSRWESLLAVDEMVADVINALEIANLMDNTYLIYTSDNGYHIGQFSQVYDKRQPYESDVKIPLLISGPGITKSTNQSPVLNIDLAPTIVSLAGLVPPQTMDGNVIEMTKDVKERYMLVEYYGEGNTNTVAEDCPWKYDGNNLSQCYPQYECKCQDSRNNTYMCVRHFALRTNFKYCLFAGKEVFKEAYDLNEDPFEMENIIDRLFPAIRNWYKLQLHTLMACKGADECGHPVHKS